MDFKLGIVLLTIGSFIFSCQSPPSSSDQKRQVIQLNIHSDPPSLDPRKPNDTASIPIIHMCFEGLIRLGPNDSLEMGIAEKVDVSEDGMVYTFFLRDAKWIDGVSVTAYDFEKTWKTILDPSFPSEFANDLYVLKNGRAAKEGKCSLNDVGVKALDDHTLLTNLENPIPYFLSMVATHSFLASPAHITEKYPNWADKAGDHYVGNGPFKLKSWRRHDQIIVEKNESYWDAQSVKLDEIKMAVIEDENTELYMYENGELDWAGSPLSVLPSDALLALTKKGLVTTSPIAATYFYIFNTKMAPFNNVKMRRAFAMAINRQDIVENITQANQIPATGIVPPTMWKDRPALFKDGDITEARRLFNEALKEMKIKAEDLAPITLSYNTTQGHHKIAQAIQEQWQKAFGVKVSLENKEWKVFLDEVTKKQFQVARMGGVASYNDAYTFLENYRFNDFKNTTGWVNPRFTELLDIAEKTHDAVERTRILKEAEELLIEEMPIAPIYFYTSSYLKKPYVKGVHLSELNNIDFKHAYIEK